MSIAYIDGLQARSLSTNMKTRHRDEREQHFVVLGLRSNPKKWSEQAIFRLGTRRSAQFANETWPNSGHRTHAKSQKRNAGNGSSDGAGGAEKCKARRRRKSWIANSEAGVARTLYGSAAYRERCDLRMIKQTRARRLADCLVSFNAKKLIGRRADSRHTQLSRLHSFLHPLTPTTSPLPTSKFRSLIYAPAKSAAASASGNGTLWPGSGQASACTAR